MDQAVYETTLDQTQWMQVFKAEYLRRTGITWEDGGGTEEEALDRYYPHDCPLDAVMHNMDKYGLDDITDPWIGGK